MKTAILLFLLSLLIKTNVNAASEGRVIYGDDNRLDVYQVESEAIRMISESTAAMISTSKLSKLVDGKYKIQLGSYSQRYDLCQDEPFYNQPTAASCSGFLVGEDLLVTAGHCIRSSSDCDSQSFVFGFKMIDSNTSVSLVSENQVYKCKSIIKQSATLSKDYALIRLDRKVAGYQPLKIRREGRLNVGDAIIVIGHPAGLPTKVAGGANVRSWSSDNAYFQSNLDTYGGNSGSAVFNASTFEVEGILVRGATDYVYDSNRQCRMSNVCSNEGCRGEDVTSIALIANQIPRK